MSTSKPKDLYRRAGVEDVAEFYRTRYVSGDLLDARYFDALYRLDIRWARTLWVYENVRRGASVLDLGCGSGTLALLKRKGVRLTGLDLSADCARTSRFNGYDTTCVGQLTALPFLDQSFDYVVSLDVMGHVEFEWKDAVLAEVRRVLRPGGVTLHGIECLDREKRKGYDQMSEEELRRFVSVDGHVGMEDELEIETRFRRFFAEVQTAPRFAICQSHEEFLKQADEYGTPLCEPDFLEYLRAMSFKERRAFNLAMGYVFNQISEHGIRFPKSEYLLVKASAAPLGPFYHEHREEYDWLSLRDEMAGQSSVCLDRDGRARFDAGWYEAEMLPPVARWMGARGRIHFRAASVSKLRLDLTTHLPDLETRPLTLRLFLQGREVHSVSLRRAGWQELTVDILDQPAAEEGAQAYELEIRADRTWQPRPEDERQRDDRELSIAVCNIEVFP
jgi:ubiquinone/menaquinone biosynthesis C-methylase UbiE